MKNLMAADGIDHTRCMLAHVAAHDELFGRSHEYTVFTAVTPIPPHAAKVLDR